MPWLFVLFSALCEPVWTYFLKQSQGFTRLWPTAITLVVSGISFICLSFALKKLPLGTGYAVWTGIGTVGTAVMGMLLLGESTAAVRLLCIAVIIAGCIGLRLTQS